MVKGLTSAQVKENLSKYGPNELKEEKKNKDLEILKRQFASILILILAIAAGISYITNDIIEFYFILIIIVVIVLTGFFQERKAEKVIQELKKLSEPVVYVIRDGKKIEVQSKHIVPEDVLVLKMGDKIPADSKIIESIDLKIDESPITGESNTVRKEADDKIYSGTFIVHGKGLAVVTATGMHTEIGKIAKDIQQKESDTPLHRKISKLGKKLGFIALAAALLVGILGFLQQAPLPELLTVTIALAVAAIPEGLPLALTLTLSIGVFGLSKKWATMRRMASVESLGSTTVICTDKTGTLTQNEMTIEKIYTHEKEFDVEGVGYNPEGSIKHEGNEIKISDHGALNELVRTGMLCNDSYLVNNDGEFNIQGDPIEGALVTLGKKTGQSKDELNKKFERIKEYMFTSERKMMSTINKNPENNKDTSFVKGAPEIILDKCSQLRKDDEIVPLDENTKNKILEKNHSYAEKALRVLALAYKPEISSHDKNDSENDLIFLGLVAMKDPPREGVKETIAICKNAGIQIKMVTGDNSATAKAIAKQIKLTNNPQVITGKELSEMSDEELAKIVTKTDIFARTMPDDKYRLVKAIQMNNEIVAMTGDGINDAPAVKAADVGVGMGKKGTDVTKEASDIVLQDDNFKTLVTAVKEGRRIFDNIEKITSYLISTNFAQVMIIAVGIAILGFEYLPLIALQILFINVIGGEVLAISLGVEPGEKNIMKRPARATNIGILHKRNIFLTLSLGVFMTAVLIAVFIYANPHKDLDYARSAIFAVNNLMFIAYTFNFKSLNQNLLNIGIFSNKWVNIGALFTLVLVLMTIYLAPIANIFSHVPLEINFWIISIIASIATIFFVEVIKIVSNKYIDTSYMWKDRLEN